MKKWMLYWTKKARMTPSHVCWPPHLQETTIADKITASAKRGIFLSLPWVAQLFSLSPFEVQTLIMCLAPELRRKYDTLYAYLQDDITRKRPSVDLVLDVLCPSEAERWRARTAVFSDQAPLFRHGILHRVEDPRSPVRFQRPGAILTARPADAPLYFGE